MTMNKYLINHESTGPEEYIRTVEANSYKVADGYFHFYAGFSTSAERVFSIDAQVVRSVEVAND